MENKTLCAYSGSLIQRNYGEPIQSHGFLIWDLQQKKVNFKSISNEYAFLNVIFKEGKPYLQAKDFPNVETDSTLIPFDINLLQEFKILRIKIKYQNTNPVDIENFISDLKEQFEVEQVIKLEISDYDEKQDLSVEGIFTTADDFENYSDVKVQDELIDLFAQSILKRDEVDIESLKRLNESYNKGIRRQEYNYGVKIKLIDLEFSNLFKYGEDNYINFDSFSGIVGLFGPNRIGKSSLIHILLWMIYDKTPKINRNIQIVNIKKDNFSAKLRFQIGNETFVIEKSGRIKTTRKGERKLEYDVQFYKETEQGKVSLNGEQRKETALNILKYVGRLETSLITNIKLQQFSQYDFTKISQKDRRALFSDFLGLNIFKELYEKANEDKKILQKEIKGVNLEEFFERKRQLEQNLKSIEEKLIQGDKELNQLKVKLEELQKEKEDLISQKKNIDSELVNHSEKDLEQEIQILRNLYKQKLEKKNSLIKDLDNLQKQYDNFKIENTNENELQNQINELRKIDQEKNQLEKELARIETQIQSKQNTVKRYSSLEFDVDNCSFCKQNYEFLSSEQITIQNDLTDLQKRSGELRKQINEKANQIKPLPDLESKLNEYRAKLNQKIQIERKISNIKHQVLQIEKELEKITSDGKEKRRLLEEIQKISDILNFNLEIDKQINSKEIEIVEAKQKIRYWENQILNYKSQQISIQKDLEDLISKIREYEQKEREFRLISDYVKLMHDTGISLKILENSINKVKELTNRILSNISDFSIDIKIEKDNILIYLVKDEKRWGVELASGMESFLINISLRVALFIMNRLPKFNFFVIDEGWSYLDSDNRLKLKPMFEFLSEFFDFNLIVSHIPEIQDYVNDEIKITLENDFSKIEN